jgi:hypothetical protein
MSSPYALVDNLVFAAVPVLKISEVRNAIMIA